MTSDATAAPTGVRTSRIAGIDVARALAIVGMFAVHVGPTDVNGISGRLYASPHGRASLLFVLVAGVGVSLLARSRSTTLDEARWRLGWRAVLLLPVGLALQELDHGASVILQDYALLFLLAIAVLGLSARWLLSLAVTAAVLGPVGFYLGQAVTPATFDRAPTALTTPAGEVLHGLVLSGPYPLITWAAPFLFGLWLGHQDLRSRRVRLWLLGAGAGVAATALLGARALVAVLGPPTTLADPRHLVSSDAHSQMPLWLIGGTGAAAALLAASLLVTDRLRRSTWPLVATGQLALTVYVAHLLALHAAPEALRADRLTDGVVVLAAFVVTAVAVATSWRAAFQRGPLELLLTPPPWLSRGIQAASGPPEPAIVLPARRRARNTISSHSSEKAMPSAPTDSG